MPAEEIEHSLYQKQPRASTAFVFLAAFAIIISWLAVYAVPNALTAGHLMGPLNTIEDDPRPRWMLWTFTALFVGFAILGLLFGWTGYRQLSRLDAAVED